MSKYSKQMKFIVTAITRIFAVAVIFCAGNAKVLQSQGISFFGLSPLPLAALFLLLLILLHIFPSVYNRFLKSKKLRICADGCELLILFAISTTLSLVFLLCGVFGSFGLPSPIDEPKLWLINSLFVFLVEFLLFWNGIIRVYLTSTQLGVRLRVIGVICGMIPIVHLVLLGIIIYKVSGEIAFENDKIKTNLARASEEICKTQYPLLLVHGVFFRDFRYLNYWGRIPGELETNGATIYYGNQQSAASVENCGKELAKRILQITEETGCEKINIIAHSKGGLDARYALTLPDVAEHVASLTTINTPHRGCEFADYLLSKISKKKQQSLADTYNNALKNLGDTNPDFLAAVKDLTAAACKERNETVLDASGVYYQSVGSKLKNAISGRFPLNFSHPLVNRFDGANDGLVGETSFPWGQNYQFLEPVGLRGISHGDMIDLNRENFPGFDVREFFVQLVADLKNKGF